MSHNTKTAIITGASRGIGYQVASYFASKNYTLLLISKDLEKLEQAKISLIDKFPNSIIHLSAIDIANPESVNKSIKGFQSKFKNIDLLFNNAGYVKRGTSDLEYSEFIKMINVNLIGSFNLIKAVVPFLKVQRFGHIINMSSRNAKIPRSFLGGYAATKSAILAFNDSLYKELSEYGIKVTAFVPGFVDTHMTKDVNLPREELIQTEDFYNFLDLILSLKDNVALKEICFEAKPQVGGYP